VTGANLHRSQQFERERLLFVVNDAPSFVARRLRIACAARDAGYEVHVATPNVPKRRATDPATSFHDMAPDEAIATILGERLAFHPLPMTRRSMNPVQELRSIRFLAALYRRLRPHLVHHISLKPILYGTLAARLVGTPAVVNSFVGLGYLFATDGYIARMRRRSLLRVYGRLAVPGRVRSVFQNPDDRATICAGSGIAATDTSLIRGSGVDLVRFVVAPESAGELVVVLAGRMLWDKGVAEFREAAAILRKRGVSARFVLVGGTDPDNPAALSVEQLNAWAAAGDVEWWGQRDDMPGLLASVHVVCLPSYHEGVPRVLLEASASGRALVATDVSGCREVVRHGENGLLVPPKNAGALADALQRLIERPGLRRQMGREARRIAERDFDLDIVVRRTLALYRELLGPSDTPIFEADSQAPSNLYQETIDDRLPSITQEIGS
jgi:glycosyltransferase involved in cell wall biosynthesis